MAGKLAKQGSHRSLFDDPKNSSRSVHDSTDLPRESLPQNLKKQTAKIKSVPSVNPKFTLDSKFGKSLRTALSKRVLKKQAVIRQ